MDFSTRVGVRYSLLFTNYFFFFSANGGLGYEQNGQKPDMGKMRYYAPFIRRIFPGDFALVRIGVRGQSSRSELCYLEDNEHKELYWLHRNNYAASEPGGQQGRAGLQAPSLHSPALTICSVPLIWYSVPCGCQGPTALVLLLPRCGHRSLVVMDQFKPPHETPSHANCATGRTAYGYRCLSFIRVLWTGKNNWFRKASCGACMLLWKKHFFKLLLYPCAFDIFSCALPHSLMPIMLPKEEQRGWVWWLKGVPLLCMSGGEKYTRKLSFCTR